MWKSSVDVKVIMDGLDEHELLDRLYSLSVFWKNAIYPDGYKADESWVSLLTFSKESRSLISDLSLIYETHERPEINLALFGMFFHHNLIFDYKKSNIKGICELLENEILSEKIRFPYRFGRCLYDRFNDVNQPNRTNHITPEDAKKLFEGSPKGVYQVGNIVIGPLGVINSAEPRVLNPSLWLPLWHCSDTGCSAIHDVELLPPVTPLQKTYHAIKQILLDKHGPPSEWRFVLQWNHRKGRWDNGRTYSTVVEIIADCIFGTERTDLTSYALKGSSKIVLREILGKPPRKKNLSEGRPEEVACRLSPEEQLQLLMVVEDNLLIEYIDELTARKIIKIPLGERRAPKFSAYGRNNDETSELSSLGIRSNNDDAIVNMSSLIWNAYDADGLLNELEWKVRQSSAKNVRESLFSYIRDYGPEKAIKNLVFTSSIVTKRICREVKISLSLVTNGDDIAIERMLWKLGFNPEEFDDVLRRLRTRLRDFNEKLLSIFPIDNEDDREAIRSVGVNLFVSLEEYIDKIISFNIWLLSDDHFVSNRFNYDINTARQSVINVLGSSLSGDGVSFSWSTKGDNALGTLLRYLAQASSWIKSLEEKNRDEIKRCEDDLPFYANNKLRPFQFRHTQFWADADLSELIKYKEGFSSIANLIHQADLSSVRNGIDHYREENDFPDRDKMLACVAKLQLAVDNSDINRYFPKPYWLMSRKGDRYGLVEYIYKDFDAKEFRIFGPPVVNGLPRKVYKIPVVIAPGNLLGFPNSQLMFQIRERSEYSKYWDGYPRRRKIEALVDQDEAASEADLADVKT